MLTPIGWLAVYDDGAGGETILRSTDGLLPKNLARDRCLGARVFYQETVSIDDGPDIHYSDIWVSWDWIVFYEDGRGVWRVRNSAVDDSRGREEAKEGILVADARWDSIVAARFLNNEDNRVGQW